jgi:hypothetical protein
MLTVMGQALPPPAYASRNLYLLPGATVNVDKGGSGPSAPPNFWNRHVHDLITDVYLWQMERTSMGLLTDVTSDVSLSNALNVFSSTGVKS